MQSIRALKYATLFILPVMAVASIRAGGWYTFIPLGYSFLFIPLLELFMKPSEANMDKVQEQVVKKDKLYDYMVWFTVPMHYAFLFYILWLLSSWSGYTWTGVETAGLISMAALSCGVIGINVAHELGHRRTKHERIMAKLLLLTSQYMHFYIEHNKGHHRNVSTPEDPASARYGESLYAFWFRSMIFSYISAWKIEFKRLDKAGEPKWSPIHNEMLRFQLIQIVFAVGIGLAFGWVVMGYYLIMAVGGALLLETVNYIEHYGLQRKKVGENRYERTLPIHSWNSNHPIGRLMLFELSRHSDHHYMPGRKYQILRHHDDAPQMPTGYPGMMLLSTIPPLWFYVMHRKIARLRNENADGMALA